MPAARLDKARLNSMAQVHGSPVQAILEAIQTAVTDQINNYAEWAEEDHGADEDELNAAAAYSLNMIAGSAMGASVMLLCGLGLSPAAAKSFTVHEITRLAQSSMEQAVTEKLIEAGHSAEQVEEVLKAARASHARNEDPEGSDDNGNAT